MATIRSAVFPVITSGAEGAPVKGSRVVDRPDSSTYKAAHKPAVTASPSAALDETISENPAVESGTKNAGFYHFNKTKVKEPARLGQFIDIKV